MKHHLPPPRDLTTLDAFVSLMAETAAARTQAAAAILAGRPVPGETLPPLLQALSDLEEAGGRDGRAPLEVAEDQMATLDLSEERAQVENDVVYLEQGREALLKHLGRQHHGFREAVSRGLRLVSDLRCNVLFYDGDGALRAFGQRFASAVQPAWNAVALTRFALARAGRPLLWTTAPLGPSGLDGQLTMPSGVFAFAGSEGRQYRTADGRAGEAPLSSEKDALLTSINARLADLLADPFWRVFGYVGSGVQFCRGETIVARQDDRESVDEELSLSLLEHIHDVVDAVDPERIHFRVEDDGLDVAIVPTAAREDVWREFAPEEGLRLVEAGLDLHLDRGPHLACCGGSAGIPLLAALAARSQGTRCLFVTDREDLAARARAVCPGTVIVSHPDVLTGILSSAAP